jgi:hypothetical protein
VTKSLQIRILFPKRSGALPDISAWLAVLMDPSAGPLRPASQGPAAAAISSGG